MEETTLLHAHAERYSVRTSTTRLYTCVLAKVEEGGEEGYKVNRWQRAQCAVSNKAAARTGLPCKCGWVREV